MKAKTWSGSTSAAYINGKPRKVVRKGLKTR
jgi:hypothetical protein